MLSHVTSVESTLRGHWRPCSVTPAGPRCPQIPELPPSHKLPGVPRGRGLLQAPVRPGTAPSHPLTSEEALSQGGLASFPMCRSGREVICWRLLTYRPRGARGLQDWLEPQGPSRDRSKGPVWRPPPVCPPDTHSHCPRFRGPPRLCRSPQRPQVKVP